MATKALDVATIMHALLAFEDEIGSASGLKWCTVNPEQEWVFDFLEKNRTHVEDLKDINSRAEREGMEIKVVSILDKTVKWLEGVAEPEIIRNRGVKYPAFRLKEGCRVCSVKGFGKEPLMVIKTKSGDSLYVMMIEGNFQGLDMFKKALEILEAPKVPHPEYVRYPSVVMPKVDFKLSPDINFMQGASTDSAVPWTITNAMQKFKFRMNEEGARAHVETRMAFFGCSANMDVKKKEIVVNRPFFCFFIQPGVDIPLAVFYADLDSWKDAGKLEDL